MQQLQEKLEAAKKKISQLETKVQSQNAEIAALRCMLVVI